MTYILSAQRNVDDINEVTRLWAAYREFIRANQSKFPPGALRLAQSGWYYGSSDHRAPHDAWLEWARFEEPSHGVRSEVRRLDLRLRLLGAYHDLWLEFYYPGVVAYQMSNENSKAGHGDWLYDEFRLSSSGNLIHEIEWAGTEGSNGSTWLIEAADVELSVHERSA